MVKTIHPIAAAEIWTHDLSDMSLLPQPIDQAAYRWRFCNICLLLCGFAYKRGSVQCCNFENREHLFSSLSSLVRLENSKIHDAILQVPRRHQSVIQRRNLPHWEFLLSIQAFSSTNKTFNCDLAIHETLWWVASSFNLLGQKMCSINQFNYKFNYSFETKVTSGFGSKVAVSSHTILRILWLSPWNLCFNTFLKEI